MMNVLSGLIFISLFSYLLIAVSLVNSACPQQAPDRCTCSSLSEGTKVKCAGENGITEIPSWLPNDTHAVVFDNCGIETLNNQSFKRLASKLKTIEVTNHKPRLTFTDGLVFQGLDELTKIVLTGNNIISLPAGLFANLPLLENVVLNDNPFTTFEDNLFENSTKVKVLAISDTQLSSDSIEKLGKGDFGTNIAELLITGTRIDRLKVGLFSGLPKMTVFAAARCNITSIEADILNGTLVTYVILNGNTIKSIDENALRDSQVTGFTCDSCQLTSNVVFNGFLKKRALEKIELQNNNIATVPSNAFASVGSLDVINLSNNNISTIEENAFANLPSCKFDNCIKLLGNPLNCDCNLAWLRSFTEKNKINDARCAQPKNVFGKTVQSLKVDEFCCTNATSRYCGLPTPDPITDPTIDPTTDPTSHLTTDPNNAWIVSAHIMVAIISQIVVLLGIPLLLA